MFCDHCGSAIDDGVLKCPVCGSELSANLAEQQTVYIPFAELTEEQQLLEAGREFDEMITDGTKKPINFITLFVCGIFMGPIVLLLILNYNAKGGKISKRDSYLFLLSLLLWTGVALYLLFTFVLWAVTRGW